MLEFEVIPEQGLRNESLEICVGMPIGLLINSLQKLASFIKGVELLYNQEAPLSQDIEILLSSQGVRCLFDSSCQRLKLIEVYDLSKLTLKYCSTVFSSPQEKPTVERIDQSFGATHPGVYDPSQQMYILSWRGLSFLFPAESNLQHNYAHGLGSLRFPDGCSPVVSKMCIYSSKTLAEASAPPQVPLKCMLGNVFLEEVTILRSDDKTRGLSLVLLAEAPSLNSSMNELQVRRLSKKVFFGDMYEDIVSSLGAPSRVYYKSDDKMKIHLPEPQRLHSEHRLPDYFLNYFTLGLDILLDGDTGEAKKFVLHTNFVGHYDFGIYTRCNFSLELQHPNSGFFQPIVGLRDDPPRESVYITPQTKWTEIQSIVLESSTSFIDPLMMEGGLDSPTRLGGSGDSSGVFPVILNRGTSNANATNPFGSTFCYGFQDIIFEVMTNDHLASVTFYDADILKDH